MIRHRSLDHQHQTGAAPESAIPAGACRSCPSRRVGVSADYAGVDIIQDRSGAPLVLEVNSAGLAGVAAVTRTRIAGFDRALPRRLPRTDRGEPARSAKRARDSASHATPGCPAFRDACLAELDALKPGNVHRFGDDPRMSVADFERSARVAALLSLQCASVGAHSRKRRRDDRCRRPTTPISALSFSQPPRLGSVERCGRRSAQAAQGSSPVSASRDARDAYASIREANHGGLGEVRAMAWARSRPLRCSSREGCGKVILTASPGTIP
jgi:hypothetical protein